MLSLRARKMLCSHLNHDRYARGKEDGPVLDRKGKYFLIFESRAHGSVIPGHSCVVSFYFGGRHMQDFDVSTEVRVHVVCL